jgi:hypothetical protein
MKNGVVKIFSFLILAISLSGCHKDYAVSEGQDILFQQEFIKSGWNYQNYGFIINSDGNVLTFRNPEKWNFPDKDNKLTKQQVKENISSCTFSGKKILKPELQKYKSFIDKISSGRVTALESAKDEMGSMVFYCYQYSEKSSTFKATIIKMEGDQQCENLNSFSKTVVDWMKDIELNNPR